MQRHSAYVQGGTPSSIRSHTSTAKSPRIRQVLPSSSKSIHQNGQESVHSPSPAQSSTKILRIGDYVTCPGDLKGVVMYYGKVEGKQGIFAGIDLDVEFWDKGKNDGSVDNIQYFTTSSGSTSGIFFPPAKLVKARMSHIDGFDGVGGMGMSPSTMETPSRMPKTRPSLGTTHSPLTPSRRSRTSLAQDGRGLPKLHPPSMSMREDKSIAGSPKVKPALSRQSISTDHGIQSRGAVPVLPKQGRVLTGLQSTPRARISPSRSPVRTVSKQAEVHSTTAIETRSVSENSSLGASMPYGRDLPKRETSILSTSLFEPTPRSTSAVSVPSVGSSEFGGSVVNSNIKNDQVEKLQIKVAKLTEQLVTIRQEADTSHALEMAKLHKRINELESEKETSLRSKNELSEDRIMHEDLEEMSAQMQVLQDFITLKSKEENSFAEKHDDEVRKLHLHIDELEKREALLNNALQEVKAGVAEKLEQGEKEIRNLCQEVLEKESLVKTLEQKVSSLTAKLDAKVEDESNSNKNLMVQLEDQLKIKDIAVHELNQELDEALDQIEKRKTENENIKKQLTDYETMLNELRQELTTEKESVSSLRAQIKTLQNCSVSVDEVRELKESIKATKRENEELKNSIEIKAYSNKLSSTLEEDLRNEIADLELIIEGQTFREEELMLEINSKWEIK